MLKDLKDYLIQQNKLLDKLCNLFERQNLLSTTPPLRENFVENLYCDEVRNGFLVTSHRKKLWNVQIGLINEFARVCKKYNLKWFAWGGTLLGAARHKGFIPWDDDVDLAMLRPDYNKFVKIAAEEFKYPYFFDNWYNYRLEIDENHSDPSELQFPLIRKDSMQQSFPFGPMIKIRDCRTTMIEVNNRKYTNQGIWIDIFPIDILPPFSDAQQLRNCALAREILMAAIFPYRIRQAMETKQPLLISYEDMKKFLVLSYHQRGTYFDNLSNEIFFRSPRVGTLFGNYWSNRTDLSIEIENFDEIVYMPFENIEIPAPIGWENYLKMAYGDWRKMVYTHSHATEYSADIPYSEYYMTSAFMR